MRALLGLFLAFLIPVASAQSPDAGTWENASFGPEGPAVGGSLVSAMVAAPNGDVFASGYFSTIGGVLANQIARWDGTQWHALGDGLTFYTSSLAVGPDGALYAAGVSATGVPGTGVVRWDGQMWTALGDLSGTGRDQVNAISVAPDGTVYAGVNTYVPFGDNGYYVGRVDRWTGTGWVPTAPLPPAEPYRVALTDLAVSADGTLYAAQTTGVSAWTGTSWAPIGGGGVAVLAAGAGSTVYAGGGLTIGGTYGVGVARWDGTAWARLGDTSDGFAVEALAIGAGGAVYAGGQFTTFGGAVANHVARWDGAAWRPMQGGVGKAAAGNFNTVVRALALAPDGTLHVGGRFDTAGGLFSPVIARWRGEAWQSAGGGIVGPVRALARAADGRAVIGGPFRIAGGRVVNSAAVRSGASWAPLGAGPYPSTYSSITAVERDRDGDLIACGDNTYRWDGATWSATDLGTPARCTDLAVDAARTVYAAGYFVVQGTTVQTVRRWDGDAWTSLGSPGPFTTAVAVAPDGTLYAAGRFGVARYDAGAWVTIGALAGTTATVYDLVAAPDGTLYAGGQFESVGGTVVRNVARWDGAAWRALGAGADRTVRALLVDPARGLYAGGDFTEAGGVGASRIALWNGTAWAPLGSGTDGPVHALLSDGPNGVLVGGAFARAGGTVSPYVARWAARPVAADPSPEAVTLRLALAPNPARDALSLFVTHPSGHVTVEIFDALGRHVANVFVGEVEAGEQRIPLDTSSFAPGVYVVRLTAGGRVATAHLSVVR